MYAIKLDTLPDESFEKIDPSLEKKTLFQAVRENVAKKWNAQIESKVFKKLLPKLPRLSDRDLNVLSIIRNQIKTAECEPITSTSTANHKRYITPSQKSEPLDHLILQQQFDLLSTYEIFSFDDLKEKISSNLKEYESIAHLDQLAVLTATIHAHHLSQSIDFAKKWGTRSVQAFKQFIVKQIKLHPTMPPIELVHRIVFLIHVSSQKEKKKEIVQAANDYLHSLATNLYSPTLHQLGHEVYNFINNEIRKIKSNRPLTTLKEILIEVQQMFSFLDETDALLPNQQAQNQKELLEIFIFTHFYHYHPIMHPLTSHKKELISKVLARTAVEKGEKEFRDTVHTTHVRLMRYKNLNVSTAVEQNFFCQETLLDKISHFACQNELIIDQYKISPDHPLAKWVKKSTLKENFNDVSDIVDKFLKEYPLLTAYKSYFTQEAIFLQKAFWYTQSKKSRSTPFERFYQWHYTKLKATNSDVPGSEILRQMEALTSKTLPLMPSYKLT